MNISKLIDHTALKATTSTDDVKKLCKEAIDYDFMSVCVNPAYVSLAKELLENSNVFVCTVIGFPLGANTTAVKVFETSDAIKNGADEIDMVLNISALKEKNYDLVLNEIKEVRKAASNVVLKVIFETCYLTNEEIVKACEICLEAEVDFVKTSTGFGTSGATVEVVKIMNEIVSGKCGIKASGGVRSFDDVKKMTEAGATRIGASSGVEIIKGELSKADY